jgi:hypothetical protein
MPTETGAVFLGLFLSLINFAVFAVMSAFALRQDTVTASAVMIGGLIARLGIVMAVYLYLVNSVFWEPRIYYVTAGFIPSLTILLVVEVILIIRLGDRAKQ